MKEKVVDNLGRIVIPKVFRSELGLTPGTPISFQYDPIRESLMIRKVRSICVRCSCKNNLIELNDGIYLCSNCLDEMNNKKKRKTPIR